MRSACDEQHMVGLAIDMTDQNPDKEKRCLSQEYCKFALEGAGDGVWDWQAPDTMTFSKRWKEILGYGEDEVGYTSNEWISRTHPDDLPGTLQSQQDVQEGKITSVVDEFRMSCKDGSWKWFLSRGLVVAQDCNGKPLRIVGTIAEITEHKRREQELIAAQEATEQAKTELLQAKNHLQATLAAIPDLLFELGLDGRYYDYHAHSTDLLAAPPEALLGKTVSEVLPPDAAETYLSALREASEQGRSVGREILLPLPHGDHWFELSVARKQDGENQDKRFIVLSRDITERKRIEADLLAAKSDAEKANQAKSRFLAAASHDLLQPLSALSLYFDLLKNKVTPDNNELVSHIQACIDSQKGLLSDLLDVSKLEAGVVKVKLIEVALDDLVTDLVPLLSAEAQHQGLRLRFRMSARYSGMVVRTDPQLFKRILGNLIVNAIRYTHQGGVLIACRRRQGKHWIEIWDTGIGIPEDKTEIIFEEFRQLGDAERNRGSGLGLSIVAGTAKLLGLEIRLRSRLGLGSMFAVELPPDQASIVALLPSDTLPGLAGGHC